jgi:hypothetical protein
MAFPATTQLYQREAGLQNSRAQQEYDRYIADLARQYGIAEGNLNANLEGRGIYRSGEAGTARTRLSAENQSLRSAALQDLEYRKNMNEINLLKQLASLQANSTQQATTKSPGFTDDPNSPNDRTGVPYFGYNEMQPYTVFSKTPVFKPVSTTSTVKPRSMYGEKDRLSYAGR